MEILSKNLVLILIWTVGLKNAGYNILVKKLFFLDRMWQLNTLTDIAGSVSRGYDWENREFLCVIGL